MQTVGSYEAKTHLPRLLDQVARGETIVITKRGVPVAKLVPVTEDRRESRRAVVDALIAYQRTAPPLGDLSIRQLIEEGRRW